MTDTYSHLPRGYSHHLNYSTPPFSSNEMHRAKQEIPYQLSTLPSCSECGVLFSTSDLQKHVKRGCPVDEDNDSITESDDEENYHSDTDFDDTGFDSMTNKVYEEMDDQFIQKVQSFMDNEGLTEKEAKSEAKEQMLPKNRAVFLRVYKDFVKTEMELHHSHLQKEVMLDVKKLVDNKHLKVSQAISRAVNSRKRKFDKLLQPEESDSDENDTEDTDDSDTDENTD